MGPVGPSSKDIYSKAASRANEVSTESGSGSPRGQPAWGGGCDRVTVPAIWIVGVVETRSLPLSILTSTRTALGTDHTSIDRATATPYSCHAR